MMATATIVVTFMTVETSLQFIAVENRVFFDSLHLRKRMALDADLIGWVAARLFHHFADIQQFTAAF